MEGQMALKITGQILEERNEEIDMSEYISGSKAMQMLELSRHTFEKIVKDGLVMPTIIDGKKIYTLPNVYRLYYTVEKTDNTKKCLAFKEIHCITHFSHSFVRAAAIQHY